MHTTPKTESNPTAPAPRRVFQISVRCATSALPRPNQNQSPTESLLLQNPANSTSTTKPERLHRSFGPNGHEAIATYAKSTVGRAETRAETAEMHRPKKQ